MEGRSQATCRWAGVLLAAPGVSVACSPPSRTELHLCVLGQQHVLALDVPVNHMMDVEMRQALNRETD